MKTEYIYQKGRTYVRMEPEKTYGEGCGGCKYSLRMLSFTCDNCKNMKNFQPVIEGYYQY